MMTRMITPWLIGIIAAILMLLSGPVQAETIYVNGAAAGGDGTSWANAYTTIGAALDEAQTGDQIWVAGGVYQEALEITTAHNNVSLYGGFFGDETSLDQRDYIANPTTLDGSQAYHVVFLNLVTHFTLDGFTITGGQANHTTDFDDKKGGGIYAIEVNDTNLIANCTIQGNSAYDKGGGIAFFYSSPALTNCIIHGNSCDSYGGGMALEISSPTLINCTIHSNSSQIGAGLWMGYSDSFISNCKIRGNSAVGAGGYPGSGGALYAITSAPTLEDCIISGNSATHKAGGLYIVNYSQPAADYHPTLTNCTISGNSADYDGGGMLLIMSNPILENCIISGNWARRTGGGLILDYSSAILKNCNISGHSATSGVGLLMFDERSAPTLVNCIFSKNSNYAIRCINGTPTINNSLFFDNTPDDSYELDLDNGTNLLDIDPAFIMSGSGALTGTWTTASAHDTVSNTTTLTDDQASFTPGDLAGRHINPRTNKALQTLIIDNGEKFVTVSGDWSHAVNSTYRVIDYHLHYNSGALDQGDNSAAPPKDMDDDDRPYNLVADIGADEYNPATSDSDNDGTFDQSDECPDAPDKIEPGDCGCGYPDTDSDGDGTPDCNDQCPNDPNKTEPEACGCGNPDTDSDGDGTPDCNDQCPNDYDKIAPGDCGCGNPDTDSDNDGQSDCLNQAPEAWNQQTTAASGKTLKIVLSASDADQDSLVYTLLSNPSHGAATIDGNTVDYTPQAGYIGTDSFTWQTNDGLADSNVATVTIQVDVFYTLAVTREGNGQGSVSSSPAGIDCGAVCQYDFQNETQVTLTATPDEKSIFGGWQEGPCQGRDDCTITLDQDTDLTAVFVLSSTGGESGSGCFIKSLH